MPLPAEGAIVCNPIFDIHYQAAGFFGCSEHGLSKGKEPLDVAVGVNPAVCTRIRVGGACKKQVNTLPRKTRQQLRGISQRDTFAQYLFEQFALTAIRIRRPFEGLWRVGNHWQGPDRVVRHLNPCLIGHFLHPSLLVPLILLCAKLTDHPIFL